MKRLLCCRRSYAEVYSQAYSFNLDDRYLAKQKYCPSSSSMLSSGNSFSAVGTEDDLVEVFASVDLCKSGSDVSATLKKKITTQTPLASMALKTVTSIEEQEAGELDIEAHLEQDDESYSSNANDRMGEKDEAQLDAMDYHVVSKYCAETNRRRRKKVFPILLIKEKMMKMKRTKANGKEISGSNKAETQETEDSNESCCGSEPSRVQEERMIMKNASSMSGLYIESSSYDS